MFSSFRIVLTRKPSIVGSSLSYPVCLVNKRGKHGLDLGYYLINKTNGESTLVLDMMTIAFYINKGAFLSKSVLTKMSPMSFDELTKLKDEKKEFNRVL